MKEVNSKVIIISSIVFYVASLMTFSFLTQSPLDIVFLGLLPFLLYLIAFFFLRNYDARALWIAPLVFPILFLILGIAQILPDMDWPVLTVVNLIISYLANILFIIIRKNEASVSVDYEQLYQKQKNKYNREIHQLRTSLKAAHEKLKVNKKNFKVSLHSIEDKCKSLNFAIGRVYGNKKGGNEKIRDAIRIPKELYNQFSELTKYFKKEDAETLNKLILDIYIKLKNLESPEYVLFPSGSYENLRLHRSLSGKDKIIEVLTDNDKDPVAHYHKEAIEVCLNVGEYLKNLH